MPLFRLPSHSTAFPDPALADASGLLAVGGDLSAERLLAAYSHGIFPWFSEGQPFLWWSPDPRLVLLPDELHVSRSLAKAIRTRRFAIRFDTAFRRVMEGCARAYRPGQKGTWITGAMVDAYERLFDLGFAHSAEAWDGDALVGGLYGVGLGSVFFGESMFAEAADASKVAFAVLVRALKDWGCTLIDCQVTTDHLLRFGAREISRTDFLDRLRVGLTHATQKGPWADSL